MATGTMTTAVKLETMARTETMEEEGGRAAAEETATETSEVRTQGLG